MTSGYVNRKYEVSEVPENASIEVRVLVNGRVFASLAAKPNSLVCVARKPDDAGFALDVVTKAENGHVFDVPNVKTETVEPWHLAALGLE